ncbi:MerR family DNA-binding transcriptional regulator [Streptomyces rhizosphaerihabitans]|uniref:MerR family DNA-binding transcriptional regulator n=1 Tax=Streptomyces rhizosphaerihabitans TaxID=1266770 RepID=UPI0021BE8292|nr:MerR family DNA-binding transcriptional regulator [Streptomyces rhizosphaerihabitans]MCT9010602.1 redoxin family protein [Streptomyces rhizosphaerihabitans]
MRISEVARRAGVTTKTVRYYESLGLINPARLANGYRDYSEHDARMVGEARELNRLGIPVERTRPFLECLADGRAHADDCPSSLAAYRDAIDELTLRIEALSTRRSALSRLLREAAYRNSLADRPVIEGNIVSHLTQLPADLPVPEDDGAAAHLPGQVVPDIELHDTAGGIVALRALGAGRSIVYCYPLTGRPDTDLPEGWDNIPGARGCTSEACDFRDHHGDLKAAGATHVFGLSSQSTAYQKEVADRLRLPFPMVSDTGFRLAAALDLPTFEAGGVVLYKRITLVVRDGVIEHVFYPVFPPDKHARQVLRWLRDNPM